MSTEEARAPNTASLGDSAARGTAMTLLTQVARAVLQFASVVVLARLLTPRDFGLIAMVTAVIGVADLVRDFGLSSAAVQAKTLSDAEQTNLFWVNLGLGSACCAVAVACSGLIAGAYSEPALQRIVVALSFVFVLSGATTQSRADLTRRLRFRALVLSDLVSQLAGVVVAVSLAFAGRGLWAIVFQQLTAAAVALLMNAVNATWRPGLPQPGVPLRSFFRFGGGLLGTQVVGYLTKNIDNIALGAYAGPISLGYYSRAYQLLMTPLNTINAPMTRVALPVLSRVQDDDVVFARYLAKAQLVGCYLTATLLAVTAGLSAPLVQVLFGSKWTAVAPVFAVLAIGGIFRAVSQISYWIYLARGVPSAQLRQVLVTGPVMVLMILAGLPWGPIGVAAGHSLAYVMQWAVGLVHAGRAARVDTRPLFRNAVRAIILVSTPCGLLAFAATWLPVPSLAQLVVGAGLGLLYIAVAQLLFAGVRADTQLVVSFARRAARRA